MDMGMPPMNGYEATRRIRAERWGAGIAIIAVTGWGQEVDRMRAVDAGCSGHLLKPVGWPDLEPVLADV